MKFKYYITPTAYGNLKEITDYVAYTLHNPKAAQDLIDKFTESIEAACIFPAGFPKKDGKKKFRKLFVGNYVVLYRVVSGILEVDSVRYGKRKQ